MAERDDDEPTQFTLSIECGNDAMRSSDDVADALEKVVSRMRGGAASGAIADVNGNTVGRFTFE